MATNVHGFLSEVISPGIWSTPKYVILINTRAGNVFLFRIEPRKFLQGVLSV